MGLLGTSTLLVMDLVVLDALMCALHARLVLDALLVAFHARLVLDFLVVALHAGLVLNALLVAFHGRWCWSVFHHRGCRRTCLAGSATTSQEFSEPSTLLFGHHHGCTRRMQVKACVVKDE